MRCDCVLGPPSDIGRPDQDKGFFIVLRRTSGERLRPPIDMTSKVLQPDEIAELRFAQATL